MNIRALLSTEVNLCVEGGESFFSEGHMPGGFEKESFIKAWMTLIESGVGTILGIFDGSTIVGALGCIFGPNLFNAKPILTEAFWYVLPQHRGGTAGIKLLRAFEHLGQSKGAKLLAMVHLKKLQPEKLANLFIKMGYSEVETAFVKELV